MDEIHGQTNPPTSRDWQAIRADYFNITDVKGWPIAALLVLVDSGRRPVRAEMHLYEELPADVREWALEQGSELLAGQYFSPELVPLRLMQSYAWRETLQVKANSAPPIAREMSIYQRWQWAAAGGAILLLIALIWAVAAFLRAPSAEENSAAPIATLPNAQTTIDPSGTATTAAPAAGNLPPSRFANPALTVGQRVRIVAGRTAALTAEPGADQQILGYLQDQQAVTIIGGPAFTAGDSDTIVWWRVRLDDGAEAWAPANTSQEAVLELAP